MNSEVDPLWRQEWYWQTIMHHVQHNDPVMSMCFLYSLCNIVHLYFLISSASDLLHSSKYMSSEIIDCYCPHPIPSLEITSDPHDDYGSDEK